VLSLLLRPENEWRLQVSFLKDKEKRSKQSLKIQTDKLTFLTDESEELKFKNLLS